MPNIACGYIPDRIVSKIQILSTFRQVFKQVIQYTISFCYTVRSHWHVIQAIAPLRAPVLPQGISADHQSLPQHQSYLDPITTSPH